MHISKKTCICENICIQIMNLLASPSAATDPQEVRGVFWGVSPPTRLSIIFLVIWSFNCSLHANVAHSRHKVLPVPVGLSRTPLFF